jgi:hypothetical protein
VEHKCHSKWQEKPRCSEKNRLRFTLSTKKLMWIFPGAKASLSGDNPASIGPPVFTSSKGNKKRNGTYNGN